MKSPFTGQAMLLQREQRTLRFRKEAFSIVFHFWLCDQSKEQFTSDDLDDINLQQVYNQYRAKHNLPFPQEIKEIREKYGVSATKMSELLGFGVNSYGQYERGEVPANSNAKMIQLVRDPKQFRKLVRLSDSLSDKKKDKLLAKAKQLIALEKEKYRQESIARYLLNKPFPDVYSGYRKPSLDKVTAMVLYFASTMQPWKTQLNKLLFYADFLMYKRHCFSISGLRYRAIEMGPVPQNYHSLFEYLDNQQHIQISRITFTDYKIGEQFKPGPEQIFDVTLFSADELDVLEVVKNHFHGVSTQQIIATSHREAAWIHNEQEKDIISYDYAFELKEIL